MGANSKMPLFEAMAWASSDPEFIQGADADTLQQLLDAALAAFEAIAPADWMENKTQTIEDVLRIRIQSEGVMGKTITKRRRDEAIEVLTSALESHVKKSKDTTLHWERYFKRLARVSRTCIRAVNAMEVRDA